VLGGNILMGVGAAHGWRPVGALARLTRVQGIWVRTLDNRPASEVYAHYFGFPSREWAYPPLNDLVRLYPLGVQEPDRLIVRSPLRVEVDGSLRMNTVLPVGRLVELMVGTRQGCLDAVQEATRQALASLAPSRPRLAVVLVDSAWQAMLDLQADAEVQAIRSVLGEGVPIVGGYTFGQIARTVPGGPVRLMNQHITIVLFGSKSVEAGASLGTKL
jgi:hypothetical protein